MEATLKMQPAVLKAVLLLVFLGLVTRSEAQATNCTALGLNGITACYGPLNLGIGSPSPACCSSLLSFPQISASAGANATCECLQLSFPDLFSAGTVNATVAIARVLSQCNIGLLGTGRVVLGILLNCVITLG